MMLKTKKKTYLLVLWIFGLVFSSYGQKIQNINNAKNAGFIENKGQVIDQFQNKRSDILFSSEIGSMIYHFRNNGISYQMNMPFVNADESNQEKNVFDRKKRTKVDSTIVYRTDIEWQGSNRDFTIETGLKNEGIRNYYTTGTGEEGVQNVHSFESIIYQGIYDGVDVKFYTNKGDFEYDFYVNPETDYKQIKWRVKGADRLYVDKNGDLVISTPFGDIKENSPRAFQGKKEINCKWEIVDDIVSFKMGKYDNTQPLIIDPIVRIWGTYFGGPYYEEVFNSTQDDSSNIYICGNTGSTTSLATSGSYQTTFGGSVDAYLTKLDPDGYTVWTTYYGGPNIDDGFSCAVDRNGNVYMCGTTESDSVLATPGSHQERITLNPNILRIPYDAYLVKFNSIGQRQWATYYGGSFDEEGEYCAVDDSGNVYLVGSAQSSSGIATPGSHQDSAILGRTHPYLVKFNSNGTRLWGTYLGGYSGTGYAYSCAIGKKLNVYVSGLVSSWSTIATPNAHQISHGGGADAFLVKFSDTGSLLWGTFYGGSGNDRSFSCAVDDDDNAYFAGFTTSTDSIASSGALINSYQGNRDAFICKFSSNGVRKWGTYFGGINSESAEHCFADNKGGVYVTGFIGSDSIFTSIGSHQEKLHGAGDAFLINIDSIGNLEWGTYYGGSSIEMGYASMADSSGFIYLVGSTISTNGIATSGSPKPSITGAGFKDAFIAKFKTCQITSDSINETSCLKYTSPSGNKTWYETGTYVDSLVNVSGCDSLLFVNLTIDTVDLGVLQNTDTLFSIANNAGYQWFDCGTRTVLNGETSKTFIATINGSYAVIVTQNNCVDTSLCYSITIEIDTTVGINDFKSTLSPELYPNPSSGKVYLDFKEIQESAVVNLFNSQGQKLNSWTLKNASILETTITGSPGVYYFEIQFEERKEYFKIIKK